MSKKDIYSGIKGKTIIMLMNLVHWSAHKWFAENIGIKANDVILDIGCGGGSLLALLSEITNEKTYGIDHSRDMVKAATIRNHKNILFGDVEIQRASVSGIPFDSDFFSVVTSFETIQFWSDIINDLREVKRVLKENGRLFIMNRLPKEGSKWYEFSQLKSADDYMEALENAGFSDISVDITSKRGWIFVTAL